MSIFSVSKQVSDLIHDGNTDYDAPVKIKLDQDYPAGTELTVTDIELEVNLEDDSQVVWAAVVEE